jgi:hypothetical protein
MKKFIPVLFTLTLSVTSVWADDFTNQAVEFCRSKGGNYTMGSMVEEGDNYCRQVTCKKTNSDRYEIPEGAPGPEANVEATKKACVPKSKIDGQFDTAGAAGGATSGATSGAASGAAGGVTSGAAAGAAGGASGGNLSTAGAAAGAAGGAGGAIICEELEGAGTISPGMPCYNECKPKRDWKTLWTQKKEGFERKSCVECLLKYPGIYNVKKEYLPKDSNGKVIGDNSVSLGAGVTVRTGQVICKDGSGNVVRIDGSRCPVGTNIYTGGGTGGSVIIGGGGVTAGSTGGGSTIIIGGGAAAGSAGGIAGGVSIGGSLQLPEFCRSTKKADKQACEAWIRVNGRYACASSANPASCMGDDYYSIRSRYETDCVNCGVGTRQQSTLSGIAEIVGAIAPPLAQFGSAYVGAKAYEKSNKAWAGAMAQGFEQCRLGQQDYLNYLQTNELPGLTPEQQRQMTCNGYGLGQFAGFGGGLNSMLGMNGYSNQFLLGMMGPYGGANPYGGSLIGGAYIAGGMNGGLYGMTGLAGMNGMTGMTGMTGTGYINGVNLAGSIYGGYNNGSMYGGLYGGGVAGMTGMTGMTGTGYINGANLAGSIYGGFNGSMYGGYNSGMAGGSIIGGAYIAGGMNGGYYPGGNMTGNWGWGSGVNNGWGNGQWGSTGSFVASQQSSNIDKMLQQQGTMYQMGQLSSGYNSYGNAALNPMNVGASLYGQIRY